jgi:hypothetical protein
MDLRFDHRDRSAQLGKRGRRLVGSAGDNAFGDRNAGSRQELLGLIFVDFHETRLQSVRVNEPAKKPRRIIAVAAWGFQELIVMLAVGIELICGNLRNLWIAISLYRIRVFRFFRGSSLIEWPIHPTSRNLARTCSGVAVPVTPICWIVMDATRQPSRAA